MTQKQFIKQLMSCGVSFSAACDLVECMKDFRHRLESGKEILLIADSKIGKFIPVKVYSYEEIFQRIVERRDIFV